MKIKTLCALLLSSAAALEVESGVHIPQSNREDPNPEDDNLSTVLSTALAGAKPGVIKEPTAGKGDKEGDKQVTVGLTKNYKFHWKYACAFTKWVPSNQFLHAGQNYNPATMTLERFGFIGMDLKCEWSLIGSFWDGTGNKVMLPEKKVNFEYQPSEEFRTVEIGYPGKQVDGLRVLQTEDKTEGKNDVF